MCIVLGNLDLHLAKIEMIRTWSQSHIPNLPAKDTTGFEIMNKSL